MKLSKENIEALDSLYRSNLINSMTGIKPAHLIGTVSGSGITNLAIYSSTFHLGSDPALVGFITRPDETKDTYQNILNTKQYTLNHVHESFVERAHGTSAKFGKQQSEFDTCQLTPCYTDGFKAPFVQESKLQIGLDYVESVTIQANNTVMVIGAVHTLLIADALVSEQGLIVLDAAQDVGVTGYDTYFKLEKLASFPYAKVDDTPKSQ